MATSELKLMTELVIS